MESNDESMEHPSWHREYAVKVSPLVGWPAKDWWSPSDRLLLIFLRAMGLTFGQCGAVLDKSRDAVAGQWRRIQEIDCES